MFSRFANLDVALWFAVIAMQAVLAIAVWRNVFYRSYPWFTAFTLIATFNHAALLLALSLSSLSAYGWLVISGSAAANLAILGSVAELYRRIIGSGTTLPQWVLRDYFKCLLVTFAVVWPVAFTVDLAIGAHPFGGFMRTFATVDEIVNGAILTVLVVLLLYAHDLKLKGRRVDKGLAGGLMVYLAVTLLADVMRCHGSISMAVVAQRVSQAAYCATLLAWISSIGYRGPGLKLASMDEIREQKEKLVAIETHLKLRA